LNERVSQRFYVDRVDHLDGEHKVALFPHLSGVFGGPGRAGHEGWAHAGLKIAIVAPGKTGGVVVGSQTVAIVGLEAHRPH